MTFTLDPGVDILKMYAYVRNEFYRWRHSNVRARTGQTDRHTRPNALPRHIRGW